MLSSRKTGAADRSSGAVSQHLSKRAWVFMGDYTRNRPTHCSVLRRERVTALEKKAPAIAGKRPLASECVFKYHRVEVCIDTRFAGKQPSLALLIVAHYVSE